MPVWPVYPALSPFIDFRIVNVICLELHAAKSVEVVYDRWYALPPVNLFFIDDYVVWVLLAVLKEQVHDAISKADAAILLVLELRISLLSVIDKVRCAHSIYSCMQSIAQSSSSKSMHSFPPNTSIIFPNAGISSS